MGVTVKRYVKLYFCFLRNCLVREMEFRANFIIGMIGNLIQLAFTLIFFGVVYYNVKTIAGWNVFETMFLLATNHLINSLYSALLGGNVTAISSHVETGSLDFILTKPVNHQFLVSTRHIDMGGFTNALLSFPIFWYSLNHLNVVLTLTLLDFP